MRVGILTLHGGFNHGSFLQAYCLQQYLAGQGLDVEIINYRPRKLYKLEYATFLFFKPFFTFWSLKDRINNFKKIRKFWKAQQLFNLTPPSHKIADINTSLYDCVILGSDEIWNVQNPHAGAGDPVYFGKGIKSKTIISYGTSFGHTSDPELISTELRELMNRIDFYAVRDDNSMNILKSFGIQSLKVLDPTFLYDISRKAVEPPEKNYIVLYLNAMNRNDIHKVISFSQRTGKKIISVAYPTHWCNVNKINVDPFEWAGYFQYADFVITNTFHGIIYSILYKKKFACVNIGSKNIKISDLLRMVDLENHILTDAGDLEKMYITDIDYTRVFNTIEENRNISCHYLHSILKNEYRPHQYL